MHKIKEAKVWLGQLATRKEIVIALGVFFILQKLL